MEKKCDEKIELLDKYNSYVIEPLKLIINKEDDKKKRLFQKKIIMILYLNIIYIRFTNIYICLLKLL